MRYPSRAWPEKNPGFCTCRKRDGAATSALQAPSLAPSSGLGPANDTNAGPVVPATPAPAGPSGTVAAASFTAMRKVVEFKEMGMGALANTCGLGMALKAMADSEKNPILIDGASLKCVTVCCLALYNCNHRRLWLVD